MGSGDLIFDRYSFPHNEKKSENNGTGRRGGARNVTGRISTDLVVADVIAVGPQHVEVHDAALRAFAPVLRVRVRPEHRKSISVPRPTHPAVQVRGQSERPPGHLPHRTGQRAQSVESVANRDR